MIARFTHCCAKICLEGIYLKGNLGFGSLFLKSLRPILLVIFVIIVLLGSLVIYDQIKTGQDRRLADSLSQNIDVKSDCNTVLIGPNEKFKFTFTFENDNDQSVFIERIGIDLNLIGNGEKKFSAVLGTKPSTGHLGREGKFQIHQFSTPIEIEGNSKQEVKLNMKTTNRKQAGAKPNTIVIYEGEVRFFLSPEFTNTGNCQIQVRYPN